MSSDETNERVFAATFMLIVGVVGILTNGFAGMMFLRSNSLHCAFGFICVSRSVANVAALLIYCVWTVPTTYLNAMISMWVSRQMGTLIWYSFFSCVFSQVLLSVNRLLSIYLPMTYGKVFTFGNTKMLIAVTWVLAAAFPFATFFESCGIYYDPWDMVWAFDERPCGQNLSRFGAFYFALSMFVAVASMDIATLTKLRQSSKLTKSSSVSVTQQRQRNSRERRFVAQTIVTGTMFIVQNIAFNFFSAFAKTKLEIFMSTTIIWELAHTLDGLIFVTFNIEIRRAMFSPQRWKNPNSERTRVIAVASRVSNTSRANHPMSRK